jgi:peptidoglycan hydrolase-like amidase/peptidoglycan hydrolase-like protein with peptidoglycan-binding domain
MTPTLRRISSALVAAATVVAVLGPASVARADEGRLPGGIVVTGRGFGHGRGLSQFGAYGWATQRGWGWEQIVDFYYGGATGNARGVLDAPQQEMSVVLTAMDAKRVGIYARQTAVVGDDGSLRLLEDPDQGRRWAAMVAREKSGAQRVYQVWGSGTRACPAEGTDLGGAGWTLVGEFAEGASFATDGSLDPAAAPTSAVGLCEPRGGGVNVRYYRGVVRATNNARNENRTINLVRMDDYLRGVVPRESPATWGEAAGGAGMHALRAQAVAARSYAATENRYAGLARTCDSQDCQVYGGAALRSSPGATPSVLEHPLTDRAVAETSGVVVRAGGGAGPVVRTEFSSSNGGRTAGGAFPAQADEGDLAANSSLMVWTRVLSATAIAARYPQIGALAAVTTAHDGQGGDFGGYTTQVTIAGTTGAVTMSGWDFRSAFDLPAPWYGATAVYGAPLEAAPVGAMLFIGDSVGESIAAEWGAVVSPAYPSVNFQALSNRCMVGAGCVAPDKGQPDAIGVVNSLSAESLPAVAIVQLGYNDDPSTIAGDVAQVVTAFNARGVRRIVFVNLSTRRASAGYDVANAALAAAAVTYPNVSVLDWNAASAGGDRDRWFRDDVHLTTTGRAEFAMFLRRELDALRDAGTIAAGTADVVPLAVPLVQGNRGTPVADLQRALNAALGLRKRERLATDGVLGKGTVAAVARFEETQGLPADGVADADVLARLGLDPAAFALRAGARHATVATAQTALARVLKVRMAADGIYGSGTAKQVRRFQKVVGLRQTGELDRTTWLALLAASAAAGG